MTSFLLCGRDATSASILAGFPFSRIDSAHSTVTQCEAERGSRAVCSTHSGNVGGRVGRRLFVAGLGVAALAATPAMAGDLPINAPPYAPLYRAPPIIALNWTGCYLGGHIGGGFIDKKFGQFVDTAVPIGALTSFPI